MGPSAAIDPEAFSTDDPAFLSSIDPELKSRPRQSIPDFDSTRHPKEYLRFLAPAYTETGNEQSGAQAMRALNCARLAERTGLRFLRSLLADLAWAAGVDNPLGEPTHPLTWPDKTVMRGGWRSAIAGNERYANVRW